MAITPKPKLTPGLKSLLLSDDNWILHHVEDSALKAEKARIDPGWFHPSSLGNLCDANMAFHFLGEQPMEDHIPPITLRVFNLGHQRDEAWKGYLKRAGLSIVVPTKEDCPDCGSKKNRDGRHICIPSLRIRGDFDDHIKHPVTGETGIFEFKTKRSRLWAALQRPDPDHIIQLHCYMVAKREQKGWMVYECKDCQDVKIFPVKFDPAVWAEVETRIHRVLDALGSGRDLERACKYRCDYAGCASADFGKLVDAYRTKQGLTE